MDACENEKIVKQLVDGARAPQPRLAEQEGLPLGKE